MLCPKEAPFSGFSYIGSAISQVEVDERVG